MATVAKSTSIGIKARWAKLVALGAGGLQVASAGGVSPDGVFTKLQSAVDNANQAKTTYTAATALLTPVGAAPGGLASVVLGAASSPGAVAVVGGCVVVWALAHSILKDRTADEVSGRTV